MIVRFVCGDWKLRTGRNLLCRLSAVCPRHELLPLIIPVHASNSMRSSTILVLTLRSLAQETIKNLVLAGVGRLIVMDDAEVAAEDFGAGLLFREGDGDAGKKVSISRFVIDYEGDGRGGTFRV
jgi:hypothetical protein